MIKQLPGRSRRNLLCIFLLVDVRLAPQASDLEMMERIASQEQPFIIAFTKADKLGKTNLAKNLHAYKIHLSKEWETLPFSVVTSASNHVGREEILSLISDQVQQP
jgi:GTP-binding protein